MCFGILRSSLGGKKGVVIGGVEEEESWWVGAGLGLHKTDL